ncbi:hypothetical protein FQA39_LY15842 [Lamprigera yunnana]|nr:hypothetical protein FQA39_LY15842 [Lamprigera yunnana]
MTIYTRFLHYRYALLGSSGCGKTTLLDCLVGNKVLDSGTIQIFDKVSNNDGSISPSLSVGYMPQDNALYQDMTIIETMKYFGWISGMDTKQIEEKLENLVTFLTMSDINVQIKTLSGGEQRRVSLAVALLYDAPLLLLDEPTVGLDPLLRQAGWNHLIHLAKNMGVTILVTTHYVEETKQADVMGLMRNGYIVAEATPNSLLSKFAANNLDEVLFKISEMQNQSNDCRFILKCDSYSYNHNVAIKGTRESSMLRKIRALVWKQFVISFHNLPLFLFMLLSTAFTVASFLIGFGHDPRGISVAVVNYESNDTNCDTFSCNGSRLSCNYVQLFTNKFSYVSHHDNENAVEELLQYKNLHGYIVIRQNYSSVLRERIDKMRSISSSLIEVHHDVADKNILGYFKKSAMDAFDEFIDEYLWSCNRSSQFMHLPIHWAKPVYGDKDVEMTNIGGPSYLLVATFCLASILTSCSILAERSEGTFDRIMAMNVSHLEILVSHIISDLPVILFQLIGASISMFIVFGVPSKGSFYLVMMLAVVNSFSGMCFGYAISSLMKNESGALHVISSSMTPAIFMSGALWPREGMHPLLRNAAWVLPITQVADSVNCVLQKGCTFSKPNVYYGFLNCIVWSVVFLTISVVALGVKKK